MTIERRRIDIEGLVQGIGFRPFVYRLAQDLDLDGHVTNTAHGVQIEVQGEAADLDDFVRLLDTDKPPRARIERLSSHFLALENQSGFSIGSSTEAKTSRAILMPDLAPCDQCIADMLDPDNRRYFYPFTHCTRCGPRYSIARRLPYDRANTSMAAFELCDQCRHEYDNSRDRRFHAEANACPDCGPSLRLLDRHQRRLASGIEALEQGVAALRAGQILALKNVGGFQLLVDACNPAAVTRLRRRKQRPTKPLALLYPHLQGVLLDCELSAAERAMLAGPERPIMILSRRNRPGSPLAEAVAPDNPNLGVMLPGSPVQQLLMSLLLQPLVATSGNLAGEPLCTDNAEAITRLGAVADLFLVHDRDIIRPLDDSVIRFMDRQPVMLRRARGYAPLPVVLPGGSSGTNASLLAVGGHLKCSLALARGQRVYLSQHIGDLDSRAACDNFTRAIGDLTGLYGITPDRVIHDWHPAYTSTRWAETNSPKRLPVQHHVAHFFSCMAEHGHRGPALGISWDGTGVGEIFPEGIGARSGNPPDTGIIRGGECIHWDGSGQVRHLATLRPFPLPGGDRAIREPRRQALGLLHALAGDSAFAQAPPALLKNFSPAEIANLGRMLDLHLNTPDCTSVGRLFDAVAALLGLVVCSHFEGQAAMALEFAAASSATRDRYPFAIDWDRETGVFDWRPMIQALLEDLRDGTASADIAARFHNSLAAMILAAAQQANEPSVFLSGGVFQNKKLTETSARLLRDNGYTPHIQRTVPANDGGLALGQIYYARAMEQFAADAGNKRAGDKEAGAMGRHTPCA